MRKFRQNRDAQSTVDDRSSTFCAVDVLKIKVNACRHPREVTNKNYLYIRLIGKIIQVKSTDKAG